MEAPGSEATHTPRGFRNCQGTCDQRFQEPWQCLWSSPFSLPWWQHLQTQPSQQQGLHPRPPYPWQWWQCLWPEVPGIVPVPETRGSSNCGSTHDSAPDPPLAMAVVPQIRGTRNHGDAHNQAPSPTPGSDASDAAPSRRGLHPRCW